VTGLPLVPVGPVGPHLGERISALVDGALAADARDRALVHIAGCDQCRAEVESARLLKARLAVLPSPAVSAALTSRLLAMAEPGGPVPPTPGHLPSQPRMLNVPARLADRPGNGRPQGSRPAGRADRASSRSDNTRSARRTVRLAALAGAALSTMVVAVVGISGGVGSEGQPQPPLSQLTSNVGGVSDPLVDVTIAVRKASNRGAYATTP
jgi:anti-sigma factor RsiW